MKIPKWVVVVVLAVLCVALVGLGSRFGGVYYEDTNGDVDFTLQTITDENIINLDLEPSGLVTNVNVDTGSESYISSSFSGIERLYLKECHGEDVVINIDYLSVKKGNFKMAVVVNEQIVCEFKVNGGKQKYTAQNIDGDISLVVAGESADCSFDFSVN